MRQALSLALALGGKGRVGSAKGQTLKDGRLSAQILFQPFQESSRIALGQQRIGISMATHD
jgi:hypothetical protein